MEQRPLDIDSNDLQQQVEKEVEKAEKLAGHEGSDDLDLQDTLIGRIARSYHIFASVTALSAMTVFIGMEVLLRYGVGAGTTWVQEACTIAMFFLVISCQAHCWQKDRHIKMNIVLDRLPHGLKNLSYGIGILCGAILFGALGYQAYSDISYQIAINEATEELRLPTKYISMGVLAGCILLFACYLRWLVKLFSGLIGRKS
jgi:TRAP-type C4-dicarboxylate transport system permease small subunit